MASKTLDSLALPTMSARFDHLVVSVPDLAAAGHRWAAAGLTPHAGGRHPGGTVNALIRGPRAGYVELISAEPDAQSDWADRVRGTTGTLGFAVAVDDIEAARAALIEAGFTPREVTDGSRRTPDGTTLRWRMCQVGSQAFDPQLPFLIEWVTPMPPGPEDGPVVEALGIDLPDRSRLAMMLRTIGFPEQPGDVPWLTFNDGEVTITLTASAEHHGVTAIGFGLAHGAGSWQDLDGLSVSTAPDVRSHRGYVLLPAVEEHFARRDPALVTWPAPHPERAPLEEEYSRCLDPGKYRIIAARARAWATALAERVIAEVSDADGNLTITPHAPDTLRVQVRSTGFDGFDDNGVQIVATDSGATIAQLPACGCDACDDGSAPLLREIDDTFLHLIDGGVLHIADRRGRTVTTSLEGWAASGSFRDGEPERWIAAVDAGRTDRGWVVTRGAPWI